ncbi:MAG: alpha/beta hydrolase [Pirellulales bacterium]
MRNLSPSMGLFIASILVSHASLSSRLLAQSPTSTKATETQVIHHKTQKVDGLEIFYREAGPQSAPTIVLLHGFPTSSQMFRNLIPKLADKYHVIAPDYPGFGQSSMPKQTEFEYSFDRLATVVDHLLEKLKVQSYVLYVQDYGAPIGYRIASAHPERVRGLIVQNGNAYDEGLDNDFWKPIKDYWKNPKDTSKREALRGLLSYDATKWQYTHGVPDVERISPDGPAHDQFLLEREGNKDIQLDLFLSYGSNPPLYPKWQEYFRTHQPPMLIVWGKNDQIFPAAGAEPYRRDLKNIDFHLLDAGHFALESNGNEIANHILAFLNKANLK